MSESEELEVRLALFKYSTDKITQHVLYLLTIAGIMIAVFQSDITSNSLVVWTFFTPLIIYFFGRTIYWSNFNSGIIMVKPLGPRKEEQYHQDNMLWRFYDALNVYLPYRGKKICTIWWFGEFFRFTFWKFMFMIYYIVWCIMFIIVNYGPPNS